MKVYWKDNDENWILKDQHDFDPKLEKLGDYATVTRYDFFHDMIDSNLAIDMLKLFLEDDLDETHEKYQILKELIESEDIENCLIALEIINNI